MSTTKITTKYPPETQEAAADLYWQGYTLTEISTRLDIPYTTISGWRKRQRWDTHPVSVLVDVSLSARIKQILRKEHKSERDFRELPLLMGQQRRYELHRARLNAMAAANETVTAKTGNQKLSQRGRKKNAEKNAFTDEQIAQLRKLFFDRMFDYQKLWYENRDQRTRNILKSRQIGATYYFAFEALIDAIETGRNKIFLSASKSQAHIFRDYIRDFADEVDVELKGADTIKLWNGAKLRFLSTNSSTSQGYNGDLYIDEYFWIPKYSKLRKLASGMSSQKKWHTTYFSTPSAVTHEAYTFWNGEFYNRGRVKSEHIQLDVSPESLKVGRLDPDGQWRNVVTIHDALEKGCDLFDLEQLRIEFPPIEFQNLFECIFVDDTASLFSFDKLMGLLVDTQNKWADYYPNEPRPFGDQPVWIGFDPSLSIDRTSCVVMSPPSPTTGNKFRLLERYQWRGQSFEAQANHIKQLCYRFNVSRIAIDDTGIGHGVTEHVQDFKHDFNFELKAITYNAEVKAQLVTKGLDLVETRRIEVPDDWHDWVKSFLQLYSTSGDGGYLSYKARRSEETGHADLAFATLNAFSFEKMNHKKPRKRGRVRISHG